MCREAGMLAILSDPELYQTDADINTVSELAAVNFHSHFVVTGTYPNLKNIEKILNERQINSQLLPVSRGFHSSYIDQAADGFSQVIRKFPLKKPYLPIISCMDGKKNDSLTHEHFWKMV